MTGMKTAARSRRFTNESNGRKLLQAAEAFCSAKGYRTIRARGFWGAFAAWAAAREDLRPWAATPAIWASRWRRAAFRFSPAGEHQALEAQRVLVAAHRAGVSIAGLWRAIGGSRDQASRQLLAEQPWAPGALGRIAQRLKVREEDLRLPVDPSQEPLPLDGVGRKPNGAPPAGTAVPLEPSPAPPDPAPAIPAADPVVLDPIVQQAARDGSDLSGAVADAAELRRLRRVFQALVRLSRVGGSLDNRDLRGIVGYGQGRDTLDAIIADRMADARRLHATRIFAEDDGEGR